MNTRTSQPEQVLASGMRSCRFVATDGCPVTFFPFGRQAVSAPRGAFSRAAPDWISPVHRISVTAEAARRDDRLEFREVEFGDGPQGLGCGGVAEPVGQGVVPGGEFGLQGEQFGDGVVPALWPGAPVGRPPIADPDDGGRVIIFVARAVAGLAFGVAEGGLTFGLAASWHGLFSVTVTQFKGRTRVTCPPERAISSGGGMAGAFSRRTDSLPLAQAGSLQLDAVGAMDDAIQDRVTDGRVAHEFMPARHGNLAGHQ